MIVEIKDEELENVAALKVAMKNLITKYGCQAGAIQCWNQLQSELGIMPCAANALLNEEGIPVVCETDIHGAITALMVEAAGMGEARSFFADWTIRHPDIKTVSCFSTADRGRSQLPEKLRRLHIRWLLTIRVQSLQRQSTETLLWRGLTVIMENILCFSEMQKVWTVQKEWEPICGLRWITSNVWKRRS